MAARQGEIRGTRGVIEPLLVPRPATRIALLVLLVGTAELSWRLLDYKLLAYISGVLGPFCLVCATSIWSMREKVDLVLEGEHMDSKSFQSARVQARQLRARSMRRAAWVVLGAFCAVSPAISANTTGFIWHWMVIAGGVGFAESLYGYLIANSWEEQLRAQRDKLTLQQKLRGEREALIERIERSSGGPVQTSEPAAIKAKLVAGGGIH